MTIDIRPATHVVFLDADVMFYASELRDGPHMFWTTVRVSHPDDMDSVITKLTDLQSRRNIHSEINPETGVIHLAPRFKVTPIDPDQKRPEVPTIDQKRPGAFEDALVEIYREHMEEEPSHRQIKALADAFTTGVRRGATPQESPVARDIETDNLTDFLVTGDPWHAISRMDAATLARVLVDAGYRKAR
jgi:hypothetical protein